MTDEPPFPWSTYPLFFNGAMQMPNKPMTLEERARACGSRLLPLGSRDRQVALILAALREAVAEERKALREKAVEIAQHHADSHAWWVALDDLIAALDAREKEK